MPDKPRRSSRILDGLLIAAIILVGYQIIAPRLFPSASTSQQPQSGVSMRLEDSTLRRGAGPVIIVQNDTTDTLQLDPQGCLPVDVFTVSPENPADITQIFGEPATDCTAPQTSLEPAEKLRFDLSPWKYSLFGESGLYELQLRTASGATNGQDSQSEYREGIVARVSVAEPRVFTTAFRAFITKPFLNLLIFIASLLPDHNLGLSIIILTLLVKIVLFLPTQHALEGQKKMQLLQPKLEAVRKQYKDDPKAMQRETMKLWKENKVNPFQSCLPLLVQFPVLIGLFYTVRDGVHLQLSQHLLYPFYENLSWTFNAHFLGLDLTQTYVWLFPPLLVVLQFIQMKLTFHIADKKKAKEIAEKTTPQADTPQEIQQRIMLYVLPLMIGFFALRFPSAVSLYWGISTLFAIGQQLLVNREHLRVAS